MGGRQAIANRRTGWAFMVVAWLAVLLPVWGNLYECPMSRSEPSTELGCCPSSAHLPAPESSASPWFDVGCDCPSVTWEALPAEAVRDLRSDFTPAGPWIVVRYGKPSPTPARAVSSQPVLAAAAPSGPPLWLRNQSLRC